MVAAAVSVAFVVYLVNEKICSVYCYLLVSGYWLLAGPGQVLVLILVV